MVLDFVEEMLLASEVLSEYSYPKVNLEDDRIISCLKEREVFFDGQDVTLSLSINNFDTHDIHTLQVYASYGSFLAFTLVCKFAKLFLGDKSPYYISFIQDNKKIYVWTICYDLKKNVVPDKGYLSVKNDSHNGFNFLRVIEFDNRKVI